MISNLRVQNFRKHVDYAVDFSSGTNVITGANGSGKTSLIEAIYVVLRGRSWRSNFSEILREGAQWWRIDVELSSGEKRTVRFENDANSFEIDGQKFTRLPTKYKQPVVLFEPSDLNLIYGSPSRRRDFIDQIITQIEPSHGTILRKFERVLKQRNNLLKTAGHNDDLFVWDVQFADYAAQIIERRTKFIGLLDSQIDVAYQKICELDDNVRVKYNAPEKTKSAILHRLSEESRQNLPFTASGPQTHDIKFTIRNRDAKLVASRGENRTIILAVLQAVVSEIKNTAITPHIFLDDINSELDERHRRGLCDLFQNDQVIITTVAHNKSKVEREIKLTGCD